MTDKDYLLAMLVRASVAFTERTTRHGRPGARQVVEVRDGSGWVAEFDFSAHGTLVAIGIVPAMTPGVLTRLLGGLWAPQTHRDEGTHEQR